MLVMMLKSEQELKALLTKLSEWKEQQEMKEHLEKETFFEDKDLGLQILEDYDHSGVTEWIDALHWILNKTEVR
jgi:hypothetical protein